MLTHKSYVELKFHDNRLKRVAVVVRETDEMPNAQDKTKTSLRSVPVLRYYTYSVPFPPPAATGCQSHARAQGAKRWQQHGFSRSLK